MSTRVPRPLFSDDPKMERRILKLLITLSGALSVILFSLLTYSAKAEADDPPILSVPCIDGGGSAGWMYSDIPKHYFPLALLAVNEWSNDSIINHPAYSPSNTRAKYGTCIIVPSTDLTSLEDPLNYPPIISIPCVSQDESGKWAHRDLPQHLYPIALLTVHHWAIRSISYHPFYNPKEVSNKYGTCVLVPSRNSH